MPRYGGGAEDFTDQAARLDAMAARMSEIIAKETQAAAALEDLGTAQDRATAARRTGVGARQEAAELSDREAVAAEREAAAINVNTEAIERNRIARERANTVGRLPTAARGANDPAFSAAGPLIDPTTGTASQYELRRSLQVGSRRAAAIQAALGAGFVPGNAQGPVGAATRQQAATEGLAAADQGLLQAKRAYQAALRNGTEAEAAAALAAQDAAQERRQLALAERQSAAAEAQVRAAASAEAAARQEAAVATRESAAAEAQAATGGSRYLPAKIPGNAPFTTVEAVEPGLSTAVAAQRQLELQAAAQRRAEAAAARGPAAPSAAGPGLGTLIGGTSGQARSTQAYMASLSTEARAYHEAARSAGELANVQVSAAAERNALAFQREGASLGAVSQAMHRHGALTQEFILAASRGEVTLRELGSEAVVTAGKFAGWTASATAVFGLAAAIHEVYVGARDAQSGVQGLTRFIPNLNRTQASAGLESLSRSNNVSIQDAVTAQQGFARVFPDQQRSMMAADTALKAYQLDQISVADSTRYLTAIHQEFGVEANKLPGVFDQISAAQRRMGARVSEVLPAIARSAAAVRNAGGNLTQLIALAATAQVASGQTGNVVGTAFSRAASNFSRTPANQKIIESFGINASEGFTQMLIDAVKRSQTLTGEQRTQLAKAIGGPQYGGRIFQTLLGQQTRLTSTLGETSPLKAQGNAAEEMKDKLAQADQQIKALGLSLQQLGVGLARAGAFNLTGVLLHGLVDILHTANDVVSAFDKLPGPLKDALSVMAEMAVTLRVLQRFGATAALSNGPLSFLDNPQRRTQVRVLRGLRDTSSMASDEAERTQTRASALESARARSQLDAERYQASYSQALASHVPGDPASEERLTKVNADLAVARERTARLEVRAAAAAQEAADAAYLAASADAEYAAARKLSTAQVIERTKTAPVFAAVDMGVPSSRGVELIGGPPPVAGAGGALAGADAAVAGVEAEAVTASALTARGAAVRAKLEGAYGKLTRAYTGQFGSRGAIAGRLDTVAQGTIAATGTAVSATERMAVSVRGLGGKLSQLASAFGPLEIALVTYFAGDYLIKQVEQARDQSQSVADAINARATTSAQVKNQYRLANRGTTPTPGAALGAGGLGGALAGGAAGVGLAGLLAGGALGETIGAGVGQLAIPIPVLGAAIGAGVGAVGADIVHKYMVGPYEAAAKEEKKTEAVIKATQARQAARGGFIPLQSANQLVSRVEQDAKDRNAGIISQREFDHRMALHATEAMHLWDADTNAVQTAKSAIADARRAQGTAQDFAASLVGLDDKALQTQAQAISASLQDFGGSNRGYAQLRAVYEAQAGIHGGKNDAADITAISQARDAFYKGIQDTVQADLQLALGNAQTERERQDAYDAASNVYRSQILDPARQNVQQAQQSLQQAQQRLRSARAAQPQLQAPGTDTFGVPGLGGLPTPAPGTTATELRKRAQQDAADVARFKSDLAKYHTEYDAAKREYQVLAQQLRDASYQDRQQGRQTGLALAQSETGSGVQQGTLAIQSARRQVDDARSTYGQGSRQYQQAVTALNQAETQRDQAVLQNVSADNALLLARAGTDPLAQAAAQVQAAQNSLDALRATGHPDPNAIKNAQANLITQRNQQADTQRQQDQQVASLYGQLAQARNADDPVAAARAAQQAARQALALAHGRTERLQALVGLVQANNALQQAITQAEDARYQYLESLTTDPVKQARLEEQRTRKAISGTSGTTRVQALTEHNKALQNLRDQQLQSRESDIDFEQQMGRISIQGAIDRYDALLKTRNLTKQQRRDIELKVKQLSDQASSEAQGFDLNTGNIKLPTIYDVRKAFDPIRAQVREAASQARAAVGDVASTSRYDLNRGVHNHVAANISHLHNARAEVQATINIEVNDPRAEEKVYAALDRAMGTHIRARMRSRGQR